MTFQSEIINWYNVNKRDLPWRGTKDAYVIWLSEIILQQTRVEQGLPYFLKFLENFPTVQDFANASETQVLKLWQGLGYYSRGRNMLFTAKNVATDFSGVFPVEYKNLIKLKGIGDYTAAAISSFANNENKAVLDGNVFRVLGRYFGIAEPINSTNGKKQFAALAQSLIEDQTASIYNQAIMEFGALQCKPKSPSCNVCPLQLNCNAYNNNLVGSLPIKLKKVKVRERWFNYFVAVDDNQILMKQRQPGDVWQQMFDFPLLETFSESEYRSEEFNAKLIEMFGKDLKINIISEKKHLLTHQIIYVRFFGLADYIVNFNLLTDLKSVSIDEFKELPHPKVISDFVETYLSN